MEPGTSARRGWYVWRAGDGTVNGDVIHDPCLGEGLVQGWEDKVGKCATINARRNVG